MPGLIRKPNLFRRAEAAVRLHNPRFKLVVPVAGDLVRRFHPRGDVGLTFDAPASAEVVAAADGTVANAIRMPWGSLFVAIAHAGRPEFAQMPALSTMYDGLDELVVKKGDRVRAGQVIGRMSPAPAGSFLEFSLCRGRERVDPQPLLDERR